MRIESFPIQKRIVNIENLIVPGSKSITNRALVIASLTLSEVFLENALICEDTLIIYNVLQQLGVNLEIQKNGILVKSPKDLFLKYQKLKFNFGNCGTAIRFFFPFLIFFSGDFLLFGKDRLHYRPLYITDILEQVAVRYKFLKSVNFPPVQIYPNKEIFEINKLFISIQSTSQIFSGFLMLLPFLKRKFQLYLLDKTQNFSSFSYIKLTCRVMKDFGVIIHQQYSQNNDLFFYQKNNSPYKKKNRYKIESDWTNLSYFLSIIAILGGKIKIEHSRNPIQEDYFFLKILEKMGCNIQNESSYTIVEGKIKYGIDINMKNHLDLIPTLSILALFTFTSTFIRGIENLVHKECDRLYAICRELKKLGAKVNVYKDTLWIHPQKIYRSNICIETYDDHRIAMAFSLAGLKIPGLKIIDSEVVNKSFPSYFEIFKKCLDIH